LKYLTSGALIVISNNYKKKVLIKHHKIDYYCKNINTDLWYISHEPRITKNPQYYIRKYQNSILVDSKNSENLKFNNRSKINFTNTKGFDNFDK